MAWERSFQVKAMSNAKLIYFPHDWNIQKGDMILIRTTVEGRTYTNTSKVQRNTSSYVYIPKFWPVYPGDIVDFKVSFANVPVRPEPVEDKAVPEPTE